MTTVSTNTFYEGAISQMNALQTQASNLQTSISTGNKIQQSSQDPVAAAQMRSLQAADTLSAADTANANAATASLTLADNTLGQFTSIVTQVKTLATQTANATSDIAGRIDAVRKSAGDAAQIIRRMADLVRNVEASSNAIAAAVTEQNAATDEISRSVNESSRCTNEVSDGMSTVRSDAAATGASAATLLGSATDLSRQAQQLREEVVHFLNAMAQSTDRRRNRRHDIDVPVMLTPHGRAGQRGRAVNVSASGIAVESTIQTQIGEEIAVEGIAHGSLHARVVNLREGLVHLQFRHDTETRAVMSEFMQSRFAEAA